MHSTENATASALVERRVDLTISFTETTTSILAANNVVGNNVTQVKLMTAICLAITMRDVQIVTIRNNGPIDATGVVVGIKYTLANGVFLESSLLDTSVVPDTSLPNLLHWTVWVWVCVCACVHLRA